MAHSVVYRISSLMEAAVAAATGADVGNIADETTPTARNDIRWGSPYE